jgi:hypothetical protein
MCCLLVITIKGISAYLCLNLYTHNYRASSSLLLWPWCKFPEIYKSNAELENWVIIFKSVNMSDSLI